MNTMAQDSARVELYHMTIARMDKIMSKNGGSLEHLKVIYRQVEEIYKKEVYLF